MALADLLLIDLILLDDERVTERMYHSFGSIDRAWSKATEPTSSQFPR